MSRSDPAEASTLRASLAEDLAANGHLWAPEWRSAVEETPRHLFVPAFHRQGVTGWSLVTAEDPAYLPTVYSDVALTTQLTDGRSTCSSSQPSLMLLMLQALGIEEGDRVGEVATGTGYNAGLICHRVGADNLTTIEVDRKLSRLAAERLAACGYRPAVRAGDAREGFASGVTLDRVIITCGFHTFPWAVARTVREGGVVVCPLGWGNARLTKRDAALEGRFLSHGSYFMAARDEGSTGAIAYPRGTAKEVTRSTGLDVDVLNDDAFRFAQSLILGEYNDATELDEDGAPCGYRVWGADGSWAHVEAGKAVQAGPRKLWDAVEEAYSWFTENGAPVRDQFGVTVSPHGQHFWLHEPSMPLPALSGS